MAIQAATIWRVRINGSDTLCSGAFDATIAGAGTDYTDQDTAQLALTDLASVSPWTTVTSATGGFTSAMIGNAIYIASGTNFTAGRYFITGVTNTNTATVDRACGSVGNASAGVAKLGGALATINSVITAAPFGAVAGNVVYVRGQGLNEPVDIDYNVAAFGTNVGNGLHYVGYNGRPKVGHPGRIWLFSAQTTGMTVENFYFLQTASTNLTSGVVAPSGAVAHNAILYNCVLDQGGYDTRLLTGVSAMRCTFMNSGTSAAGTNAAYAQDVTTGRRGIIKDCLFKDLKAGAISVASGQVSIIGNIIQNCSGDGIVSTSDGSILDPGLISGNTIYNVTGHGINLITNYTNTVMNNIISNITGVGKYGINVSGAVASAAGSYTSIRLNGNNFYANTNDSNIALASGNLTLNPTYANAPTDLTPTNGSLRVIGGVGSL